MDEIVVTRLWMAGVVIMMAVFALIAVIGYFRHKRNGDNTQDTAGS